MSLDADDPRKGTVDDPDVEDPYAHLRDKEKEQGTAGADADEPVAEDTEPEPDAVPGAEGTGGDQAGL